MRAYTIFEFCYSCDQCTKVLILYRQVKFLLDLGMLPEWNNDIKLVYFITKHKIKT